MPKNITNQEPEYQRRSQFESIKKDTRNNVNRFEKFVNAFKSFANIPVNQSIQSFGEFLNLNTPSSSTNNQSSNNRVEHVASGKNHSLIALKDGRVFHCGHSFEYENMSPRMSVPKTPTLIDPQHFNYEKVVRVYAGYYHSIALTQNGNVYAWGKNTAGCLGYDTELFSVDNPQKIDSSHFSNYKVKHVIATGLGTLFLTENNQLYSTGYKTVSNKIIGRNTVTVAYGSTVPLLVKMNIGNNEIPVKISCGRFVLVLTDAGKVYQFHPQMPNFNSKNQYVSNTSRYSNKNAPLHLVAETHEYDPEHFNKQNIIDIESSQGMNYALTSLGQIYKWKPDELYDSAPDVEVLPKSFADRLTAKLIDSQYFNNEKIIDIKAGGEGVFINRAHYSHLFATTQTGKIFSMGDNHYSQLGIGSQEDYYFGQINPLNFNNEQIETIVPSVHSPSVFAISQSGNLYAWGDNSHYKLALGEQDIVPVPKLVDGSIFSNNASSVAVQTLNEQYISDEDEEDFVDVMNDGSDSDDSDDDSPLLNSNI